MKLHPDRRLRSGTGAGLIVSGWRGPINVNARVGIKGRETQMSTYIYIEAEANASPLCSETQSGSDFTKAGGSQGILCALRNSFSRHENQYPRKGNEGRIPSGKWGSLHPNIVGRLLLDTEIFIAGRMEREAQTSDTEIWEWKVFVAPPGRKLDTEKVEGEANKT